MEKTVKTLDPERLWLLWKSAAQGNIDDFKQHSSVIVSNVDASNSNFYLGELFSAVITMRDLFKQDEKIQETLKGIGIAIDRKVDSMEQEYYDELSRRQNNNTIMD